AEYFGLRRWLVRLATVFGLIFFFVPTLVVYIALALMLPKRPPQIYRSAEEEVFWRGVAAAPDDSLRGLIRKFSELEHRLAGMETVVTSPEFDLRRKFRDLGG